MSTQVVDPLVAIQLNRSADGDIGISVTLLGKSGEEVEVIFFDPLYYAGVVELLDSFRQPFTEAYIVGNYDEVRERIDAANPFSTNTDKLLGDSNDTD